MSRWLRNATVGGVDAATAATQGSLRRIAVTESAEAYGSGRAKVLRAQPRIIRLLRVWDATLDKRTCPICRGADGTIVGARESFPDGEPGAVHPWCRCTYTLLTETETNNGRLIEAA